MKIIRYKNEDWKVITFEDDMTLQEILEFYENEINRINKEFDDKISEYLSKYPKREQETFAEKKRQAEVVIAGGNSLYIGGKAQALWITPEQFAQIILQKNAEWTQKYLELENWKDMEIAKIKSKIHSLK